MASLTTLAAANFSTHVQQFAMTLVLFVTPGTCPHEPASLRPTLSATLSLLRQGESQNERHSIEVALCEDVRFAQEHAGVLAFPALRLYTSAAHRGDSVPFRGPLHSTAALASYLRRSVPDFVPLSLDTAKAIREEIDASEQAAVLFASDGVAVANFAAVARHNLALRQHVSFIVAPPNLAQFFDPTADDGAVSGTMATGPMLLLCRTFDEDVVPFPRDQAPALGAGVSDTTAAKILAWLELYSRPALAEIGPSNYERYAAAQLPLFWLFLNASCCADDNERIRAQIAHEARSRRGSAHFVWLDGDRYAHHARALMETPKTLPVLAAESGGAHYVYGSSLSSAETVATWVDLVLKGSLRPTMRSQAPPTDNFGPLTVVVAATFDELVLNGGGTDVLLLVTASWCTECDALASEFTKLASTWADEPRLRVAIFDAGVNDLPRHLHVQKLPSVLYFSASDGIAEANEQASPLDLSHLRTDAQLTQAVLEQTRLPLTRPTDVAHLREAIDALPELQRAARALLGENERLRQQLQG